MHTCQHLEIRNQDTFIIAITPAADQINVLASTIEKRKIKAIRLCTALPTKIHKPITMYMYGSDKKSSIFLSLWTEKRLIYVLKLLL